MEEKTYIITFCRLTTIEVNAKNKTEARKKFRTGDILGDYDEHNEKILSIKEN